VNLLLKFAELGGRVEGNCAVACSFQFYMHRYTRTYVKIEGSGMWAANNEIAKAL